MSDLQEYKCPACGGSLEFNADSQRMKCPFCDSEFDMEALKSKDEALDKASETSLEWGQSAGQQWDDGEIEGLKVYSCKSCRPQRTKSGNMLQAGNMCLRCSEMKTILTR